MELLHALELTKKTLSILADTDRHAGCSDSFYRKVVTQKITNLMTAGVPEAIDAAIAEEERRARARRPANKEGSDE